jgi:hypothetical protein
LWWRSDVALPTTRAELIAQWVERFSPKAAFHALAVEADGRWIAALPLVGRRVGWVLPAGDLPSNEWSPCGELLLDASADTDAALDCLLSSTDCLPWQVLWLNDTIPDAPRWRAMLHACDRAGFPCAHHERCHVGRVEIGHDWDTYLRHLRKAHRQNMQRVARRLNAEGRVEFELGEELSRSQVESHLRAAFEIEDQSWKGDAGTSVLGVPGMFPYFVNQAGQLADWGQLDVASLRLGNQIIAFAYGYRAKGVLFVHKIGYDPRFAAFSPGQLLFFRLLERLHHEGGVHALDFMGPLTESLARWRPTVYSVGRIAIALRHPMGRAAVYAYKKWWPTIRQLRGDRIPAGAALPVESPTAEPAGV